MQILTENPVIFQFIMFLSSSAHKAFSNLEIFFFFVLAQYDRVGVTISINFNSKLVWLFNLLCKFCMDE